MGKQLSQAQEKLRDSQIEKNVTYIKTIDSLLEEIEPFIKDSNEHNTYLVDFYERLEKAHGMLMQGEYANLYTKTFSAATSPAINFYNEINSEYAIIKENKKGEFLQPLPNLEEYQQHIDYFFNKIKPLFEDVFSENSFIIRFEGMEQVYEEFKKLESEYWNYPIEITKREVFNNREFISPLALHGLTRTLPFHIEVYIDYSPKFNTALLLKTKLTRLRGIIKSINAQLPFAELNEKVPQIQNIVSGIDKSTSVGENTKIGSKNAIGDNSSVKED